jgi:hypothetical protein
MVQPDAERFAAAHRKTGNRPLIAIRVHTIMRFDKKKVPLLPWYSFGIHRPTDGGAEQVGVWEAVEQ